MKVVKIIPLNIFDSEINIYESQKANFEKETHAEISDKNYIRTFIYSDVVKENYDVEI